MLHEDRCCGTCDHSWHNDVAVGVRLGCEKGHTPGVWSFKLPQDGKDCQDWEPKTKRKR